MWLFLCIRLTHLSRSVGERIQKLCDCIAEMMREFPGAGTESCSPLARAALSCGWDLEYTSTTVRAMLLYMGINWLGMYLSLVERLGTYLSLVERLGTYLSLVERLGTYLSLVERLGTYLSLVERLGTYLSLVERLGTYLSLVERL